MRFVPLGDVCDVVGGGTPSKQIPEYYGGDILWTTVGDMQGDYVVDTQLKITNVGLKNSSANVIPKGNVIIATRVGLGKVCILQSDAAINQDLKGILPKKGQEIAQRYLFYWFGYIGQEIIKAGTGATVQGVKLPFVKQLPFPLLPLSEQKRIVAKLDAAFAAIDKAKANVERNLKNAKELFQSKLNEVFNEEKEGWVEKSIEEVCRVVNGFAFSSEDFSVQGFIKSIKITNVGVMEFVPTSDSLLPAGFDDKHQSVSVSQGTIVVALTRTIIADGLKVAIVPKEYEGALVNQRVAALIPIGTKVLTNYLYSYFSTTMATDYVLAHVNTLMQPNLSIKDLRQMKLPIPDIAEQIDVVSQIDYFRNATEQLQSYYTRKLTELEGLKKSMLERAFRGEI
jgi:type I restriction enzyme S subunit